MFDEMERLHQCQSLRQLLAHYALPGAVDREIWQDRLMEMADVEIKQLTRLHGELIAYGWLEQNTGVTPPGRPGAVAGCYRVTPAGLRAFRQVGQEPELHEVLPGEPAIASNRAEPEGVLEAIGASAENALTAAAS
jgi:hypothetical protein